MECTCEVAITFGENTKLDMYRGYFWVVAQRVKYFVLATSKINWSLISLATKSFSLY